MNFEQLNVQPKMASALKELGIVEPTLIQQKSIPLIKSGKDIIGMSKTGSGKTAAFGVPILENLNGSRDLQALIIAPTRELALQISGELQKFSKYQKCFIATVYGGVSFGPQIDKISKAQIVVGTPGRLLDQLQRGNLNLSRLTCLVLDEADKMVEMGFIEDIEQIISKTPRRRQILLFGATISNEIDYLKRTYMNQPVVAEAEKQVQQELLQQFYYSVKQHEKFSLLVHLLKKEQTGRVIIFCSTRNTVELVYKNLTNQGIKSEIIHGKLSQNRRQRVIDNFNKGKVNLLVASSVAARGLHIDDITHVFNYDLSKDPQEYIHRIGRTARAGESGKAITLLSQKDHGLFAQILDLHKVDVKELSEEKFPRLMFQAGFRRENGFRISDGHKRNYFQHGRRPTSRSPGWKGQGNGHRNNSYHLENSSKAEGNTYHHWDNSGQKGNSFQSRDNSRSNGFRSRVDYWSENSSRSNSRFKNRFPRKRY